MAMPAMPNARAAPNGPAEPSQGPITMIQPMPMATPNARLNSCSGRRFASEFRSGVTMLIRVSPQTSGRAEPAYMLPHSASALRARSASDLRFGRTTGEKILQVEKIRTQALLACEPRLIVEVRRVRVVADAGEDL